MWVPRPDWFDLAKCRGMDPNLFFPDRFDDTGCVDEAKAVCAECPVSAECLELAMVTHEATGVWGGLSGKQRRELRRAS